MTKIRSKRELIYNIRNGNTGIIQLEIESWQFKPLENVYIATIHDYVIVNTELFGVDGSITYQEEKQLIDMKTIRYNSIDIDQLFYVLQNPIELTESYTSEMYQLISMALLYVTQQDPIYESISSDWEMIN